MIKVQGETISKEGFICPLQLDATEILYCNATDRSILGEENEFAYLYKGSGGTIWAFCEDVHNDLLLDPPKKGNFLLINWQRPDGKDAMVVGEEMDFIISDGIHAEPAAKLFSTREEAEEFYNAELLGNYSVVEVGE